MNYATYGNGATRHAFLREFLKAGGIALFLLLAVSVTHYLLNIEADRTARETSERLNVALGKTAIADSLQNVVTDLRYLAGSGALLDFLERDGTGTESDLSTELLHFVASKGIYDQVRLLDAAGRERVRINQNQGRPVVVPEPQLQNKADRYYFQETWKLPPGSIYISPLDLNVEHGRIEMPPKPMIRFGVPVSGRSGGKTGILLLNYLGQTLIDDFRRAVSNIADQAMLLNSDGFWLSSPRAEDEWGFMFDNGRSFDNRYPAEWERISREESGQLQTTNGFFSFVTVYPVFAALGGWEPGAPGAQSEPSWKIVSHVDPLALNSASAKFLRRNLPLYLSILALLLAGAALLAAANVRHRQVAGAMEFERRFRSILENMHLLSVGLDAEGKINFCNHTMLELCGRRGEALLGRDWFELCIPEAERPAARAHFQQLLQATRPLLDHEEHIRSRLGEERLVGWHDTLMRDADGKAIGITRIGDDITEARKSEDDIRKLSSAVVHSPATVMIVDSSGSIEYVNPKFTQLTG
ncbi:MAG: PAS domain S-box protein, partial [Pseudomonadota bacterium]|nr:PAS domain S-box protein [Pseudomonadota bacterium]